MQSFILRLFRWINEIQMVSFDPPIDNFQTLFPIIRAQYL